MRRKRKNPRTGRQRGREVTITYADGSTAVFEPKKITRLPPDEVRKVRCKECGAEPGEKCRTNNQNVREQNHLAREKVAERKAAIKAAKPFHLDTDWMEGQDGQ